MNMDGFDIQKVRTLIHWIDPASSLASNHSEAILHMTGACPPSNPQPKQNVCLLTQTTDGTRVKRADDPRGVLGQYTI